MRKSDGAKTDYGVWFFVVATFLFVAAPVVTPNQPGLGVTFYILDGTTVILGFLSLFRGLRTARQR